MCVAAGLVGCSRTKQEDSSRPASATSSRSPTTCGDGQRAPAEACDFGVDYEEGCPDGWGICWECDQTCQGFRLHTLDEDWGACAVHVNGRLYARREYDARGHNVLVELDDDYDGKFDHSARAAFDENGKQLFWERYDEQGRLQARHDMQLGPDGTLTAMLVDADGDGTPDSRWTYHYDAEGNPTRQDRFVADTLQERIMSRFDSAGRQVSWVRDANGDGSPDEEKRYVYDSDGNMKTYESDAAGDGVFEDVHRYKYDAQGNATLEERFAGPDGKAIERSTMKYDERGNRTHWLKDSDADGRIDERFLYGYDARGNLISFEQDTNGDGTIDVKERRAYDSEGKLVTREHRSPSGEGSMKHDYACLAKTIPNAPQRAVKGE